MPQFARSSSPNAFARVQEPAYSAGDLERLEQIIALTFIGVPFNVCLDRYER